MLDCHSFTTVLDSNRLISNSEAFSLAYARIVESISSSSPASLCGSLWLFDFEACFVVGVFGKRYRLLGYFQLFWVPTTLPPHTSALSSHSAALGRSVTALIRSLPHSAALCRPLPHSSAHSRSLPLSAACSLTQPHCDSTHPLSAAFSLTQPHSSALSRSLPLSAPLLRSQPCSAALSRSQPLSASRCRCVTATLLRLPPLCATLCPHSAALYRSLSLSAKSQWSELCISACAPCFRHPPLCPPLSHCLRQSVMSAESRPWDRLHLPEDFRLALLPASDIVPPSVALPPRPWDRLHLPEDFRPALLPASDIVPPAVAVPPRLLL